MEDLVIFLRAKDDTQTKEEINSMYKQISTLVEEYGFGIELVTNQKQAYEILKGIQEIIERYRK